jgi:hypothetical protein
VDRGGPRSGARPEGRRGVSGGLVKAEAHDRLREIVEQAVRQGDAFLLREASRALGEEPTREQWRGLAASAAAAGKERYAAEAQRQAERSEE